ncbi:MAG: alanine racemase [Lachnospiraceae bacterium]|nr:alanine racemase [Lachnospiraceae bacterium]
MRYLQRIHMNVYLNEIRYNLRTIMEQLAPGTKLCMVMKADGYGLGAEDVARAVDDLADFYAVSTSLEAMQLRAAGLSKPILILGYTWPEDYEEMIRMNVRINLFSEEDALLLSSVAESLGKKAKVHFSLDTGMSRLGFPATEESADTMVRISCLPGIEAEGLFTHFAKADDPDLGDARKQFIIFSDFIVTLKGKGLELPICHAANSAASMVMRDTSLNMVRLGIAAYGIYPSETMLRPVVLHPVMELKSRVSCIRDIPAGTGVSYGYAYVAPLPRRIATIPAGYADGYSRLLSDVGDVLIRGRRAPIRGRVCMDQMMVDVTDIPDAAVGDEVTLIGRDGSEEITVQELQDRTGILTYEIICGLSRRRVPKIYYNETTKQ